MNNLPSRTIPLPFVFGRRHLFSVSVRLAVHDITLPEALVGGIAGSSAEPSWSGDTDGFLLRNVPDPGWRTYTVHDDRIAYVLARDVWHYLVVSGSFDRFLEGRYSAKTRESFERDEARFTAQFGGSLDLREFRSAAELAEFQRHVRTVQEGHQAAADSVDVGLTQGAGDVSAFVLFANGVAVAYLGLLAQGETLQYLCAGEANDFRQWSAGAILHLKVFRRLLTDSPYIYVDFAPGESEVKRQFANGALRSAVVLTLRRTLRNRLLIKAFAFSRRFVTAAEGSANVPKAIEAALAYTH